MILEISFLGESHKPVESSLPGPLNQCVMVHKSSKTLSAKNEKRKIMAFPSNNHNNYNNNYYYATSKKGI